MRGFFSRMNPTVRGLGIVALIALVVVVLQLQATLSALALILRIAFFIAIAIVLYLLWDIAPRHGTMLRLTETSQQAERVA